MKQLVDLRLEDVLLDLEPLRLPPSLTALHIDRCGPASRAQQPRLLCHFCMLAVHPAVAFWGSSV